MQIHPQRTALILHVEEVQYTGQDPTADPGCAGGVASPISPGSPGRSPGAGAGSWGGGMVWASSLTRPSLSRCRPGGKRSVWERSIITLRVEMQFKNKLYIYVGLRRSTDINLRSPHQVDRFLQIHLTLHPVFCHGVLPLFRGGWFHKRLIKTPLSMNMSLTKPAGGSVAAAQARWVIVLLQRRITWDSSGSIFI